MILILLKNIYSSITADGSLQVQQGFLKEYFVKPVGTLWVSTFPSNIFLVSKDQET